MLFFLTWPGVGSQLGRFHFKRTGVKVAVFGKRFEASFMPHCIDLFQFLDDNGCHVWIYAPFLDFLEQEMGFLPRLAGCYSDAAGLSGCELLLSIGGDGTILEAVTLVRDSGIPVAGINSGRLGFLADVSGEELIPAMTDILQKNYHIRELNLLQVETSGGDFGELNFALNELSIAKRDNSSMITVHAWLNGEFLSSYWSDGLIIATPTGSTAYSLSVGGPIMHPQAQSFVISPIAPHNLTVRPLVIPDHFEMELKVDARGGKFMASLDSRSRVMDQETIIKVRKAGFSVRMIVRQPNFYCTLRKKLMWGADARN